MGRLGKVTHRVFGGIATLSEATDVAGRQLLDDASEDIPGSLTAGAIRHMEFLRWHWLKRKCEAHRDAEAVAGPTFEGNPHDAQNEVQASQRVVKGTTKGHVEAGKVLDC